MSTTSVAKRHPIAAGVAAFRPDVPEYYLAAISDFEASCRPFAGLRVLEIGGSSLPRRLVQDTLASAQWVCVDMLAHVNGKYQLTQRPEHYQDIGIRRLQECREIGEERYVIFDGDAARLPPAFGAYFDAVFTVNTFEHVLDLDAVLGQVVYALKPGGHLFSQFGPVWSGCNGSHFWISPEFNFSKHAPMAHWAHLLSSRAELTEEMKGAGLAADVVERLAHQVFDSSGINRRHLEEYAQSLDRSTLRDTSVERVWWRDPPTDVEARLRSLYPSFRDFTTTVARIIGTKSPDL